jgi:hypothetical protein
MLMAVVLVGPVGVQGGEDKAAACKGYVSGVVNDLVTGLRIQGRTAYLAACPGACGPASEWPGKHGRLLCNALGESQQLWSV